MKGIIYYIILGFVQGFTEPIPVSSSGHVMIVNDLIGGFRFNIDIQLLAILTNLGSLLAILFLYRKRIIQLFKDFFGYLKTKDSKLKSDFNYCWYLVIATIPAGIAGIIVTKLGLFDALEENIKFIGITLLVTALFLFLIRNIKGHKDNEHITLKDAIIIGLFQVIALVPGISRSGATIVGSMFRDLKRDTAFDFSFLLYIPISLATAILGLKDLLASNLTSAQYLCYGTATLVAMVVTYFATKWFRDVVKKGKLIYFVLYCLIVGTLVIILL